MIDAKVHSAVNDVESALTKLHEALGIQGRESDIRPLAEMFCSLDDDKQAKFFVEVVKIMETWGPGKMEHQAWYIGRHLATCECASEPARTFVDHINSAIRGYK